MEKESRIYTTDVFRPLTRLNTLDINWDLKRRSAFVMELNGLDWLDDSIL